MINLIMYFKALYFYTHNAHNLCMGQSFFSDHDFLKEMYEFSDKCYDDLVERFIGTSSAEINLIDINMKALEGIKEIDSNYMANTLKACEEINKSLNQFEVEDGGIMNLIQGQQDQLQVFIYKLKRRIK